MSWQYPQTHECITYRKVIVNARSSCLLISTLPDYDQHCLIQGTLSASEEEAHINQLLSAVSSPDSPTVIVYGRNACDPLATKKCKQLSLLGVHKVQLYSGGLFEWLLLQDVYGSAMFATTAPCKNPLDYGD